MADGSTKAIQDIKVGDTVMATDPQTGETRPKQVTATITTPDDKEFTDLTLTDDASPRGPPVAITSTSHHPYWSETRRQWSDAGDLVPGEQLRKPNGTTLTVQATRNYPYAVTTYNLTVDDFHTYYVLAGATPVLVHNCGDEDDFQIEDHVEPRHVAGGDENVEGKSTFAPELSDRDSLLNLASQSKRFIGRVQQATGNVRWVIDTGRNMGTDEHSLPTTFLTIVRRPNEGWDAGNLVTMHPGLPRDLTRPFAQ
ncbi:polymorphic toxin-type HINT domain-containing protein [Streptomyces sp. NPDC048258]|uniref:polymorphic toxin-type HINT domain-containing protein n=1 Tax=Streptomyces sp. NPDC048258 TaxID=3365527 RepID=UPI0037142003